MIDRVVFPGEKLARVSDFARISRAARRGQFKEALARAHLSAEQFADLCERFNGRMQTDRALESEFNRLLADPRVD
jgi:hypothetical protein